MSSTIRLRPVSTPIRDLHRSVEELNLDCDVNPSAAAIGAVAPEQADPTTLQAFVRGMGLARALANIVDLDEDNVRITVTDGGCPLRGSPDEVSEVVSKHHNTRPLQPDEVVAITLWPHVDGGYVVYVKFAHMVVDLVDVLHLLAEIRAFLQGEPTGRVRDRYRTHGRMLERYAGLPEARPEALQSVVGPVPVPARWGTPMIGTTEGHWLPLRDGLSFDDILSAVATTLLQTIGGGHVLQYPYSRWEYARRGGYFVEIKPLVIRPESAHEYTPDYFVRTRQEMESLGRFTFSDMTEFSTELARIRVPRIVVSDTTFMRPEQDRWSWVPVYSARALEDLKFLADRTGPGPPLMRVQYKRSFLTPDLLSEVLTKLGSLIGDHLNDGGAHANTDD